MQYALHICDRSYLIDSRDRDTDFLIEAGFGSMLAHASTCVRPVRRYTVGRADSGTGYRLWQDLEAPVVLEDAESLLYHLDKDVTISVQLERRDLFFLHAAVVAINGGAVVISGASGSGKSTMTLALLHHGFDYLSDELGPIDLQNATVSAYPHALCLKSPPPEPYALPPRTLQTGCRYHIPTDSLSASTRTQPAPLRAFIFLLPRNGRRCVHRPISTAAGAAHLMANALNSLSHPPDGLDASASLSRRIPSFELENGNLPDACRVVHDIMHR